MVGIVDSLSCLRGIQNGKYTISSLVWGEVTEDDIFVEERGGAEVTGSPTAKLLSLGMDKLEGVWVIMDVDMGKDVG